MSVQLHPQVLRKKDRHESATASAGLAQKEDEYHHLLADYQPLREASRRLLPAMQRAAELITRRDFCHPSATALKLRVGTCVASSPVQLPVHMAGQLEAEHFISQVQSQVKLILLMCTTGSRAAMSLAGLNRIVHLLVQGAAGAGLHDSAVPSHQAHNQKYRNSACFVDATGRHRLSVRAGCCGRWGP